MPVAGFLLLLSLVTVACGGGSAEDDGLTVFAAASLTEAFTEIGEAFEQQEGVAAEFNFAGSQALVTQLSEGANADIFASANLEQMERASEAGVIAGDWDIFAINRLVIIVPTDNPAGIANLEDLARDGLKITVAAEDVPVGQYTREMLDLVAADPAAPEDFRERVESNIVSNESNVRQVVTKVQLGEADAGVVYATDVTENVREDVETIDIPDRFNAIADYPIAAVDGGNEELAATFIDFLLSDEGQQILRNYGFARPMS